MCFITHRKKAADGGGRGELLVGVFAHEVGEGLGDLGGDGVLGLGTDVGVAVVVRVVRADGALEVAALVDDGVVLLLADGKVLGLTLLAEGVGIENLVVISHCCVVLCVCLCEVCFLF